MKGSIFLSVLVICLHRVGALGSVGFDAKAQYIDTRGEHAFAPPGPGDQRGVCPGLNALANHNYLPHNGIATIKQFIDAVTYVYGMGVDLALFLALYGAIFDGDGTKFSIHGPTPSVSSPLGVPKGLSYSHNNYEGDASPTRCDIYKCKQAYLLNLQRFIALHDHRDNYDLDYLTEFRAYRFNQSLFENEYFFNGQFSGIFVVPAAYTFIFRFMANKSSEYPGGFLGPRVLESFFSVRRDKDGTFNYTPGHEQIPDNWYRRAYGDEYTIPFFLLDVLDAARKYPKFLNIGGNTGTVNSFAGVDLASLTGGVYNLKNLAEGNNLFCFLFQIIVQTVPNSVETLQIQAIKALNSLIGSSSQLNCPQLEKLDPDARQKLFDRFPGFTKL